MNAQTHSTPSNNVRAIMFNMEIGMMRAFSHKCPKNTHTEGACGWSQWVMRVIQRDRPNRWYRSILDREMETIWIARIR